MSNIATFYSDVIICKRMNRKTVSNKTKKSALGEQNESLRVSFQLPADLYAHLNELAEIKGITKAKLLRSWVEYVPEINLKPNSQPTERVAAYNLKLPLSTYESAQLNAQNYGLSLSAYLRLLITSRLNTEDAESVARYLFRRTDILTLLAELESKQEHSLWELEILMRLHMQLGNYDVAWKHIYQLEKRIAHLPHENIFAAKLLLARASIAWMRRQLLNSRKYLEQALRIALVHGDRFLLSQIFGQLSVLSGILDDFEMAVEYGFRALGYIEITESPVAMMRGYVSLAGHYVHLGEGNQAKFMLHQAENLLSGMTNPGLKVFFGARAGWVYLKLGDASRAQHYLLEAKQLAEERDSKKELYYIFENLGADAVYKGEWEQAKEYIQQAEILEMRMRDAEVSRTRWWQLLILAAQGEGDEAYSELRKLVELRREVGNQSAGKYMLACIGFLFAQDKGLRERGERSLRELATTGKYDLVRRAATETLTNRKVNFF